MQHELSTILKAATGYFVLVFGAGFVLGPIRILLVVPRFGVRIAELIEAPIMLLVIVFAAKWLRELTLAEYFRERDWVAGFAYYLMLVFAIMPLLVSAWHPVSGFRNEASKAG